MFLYFRVERKEWSRLKSKGETQDTQPMQRFKVLLSLMLSSVLTGRDAFVHSYELVTQIEGQCWSFRMPERKTDHGQVQFRLVY